VRGKEFHRGILLKKFGGGVMCFKIGERRAVCKIARDRGFMMRRTR
jgi:hypothetical protein